MSTVRVPIFRSGFFDDFPCVCGHLRAAPASPRLFGEALVEPLRLIEHHFDAHRDRLGLFADNYGKLLGASGLSIYNWEQGKTRPRKSSVDAWTAIRRIGKREAARRLASLKVAELKLASKQTPAEK